MIDRDCNLGRFEVVADVSLARLMGDVYDSGLELGMIERLLKPLQLSVAVEQAESSVTLGGNIR